jgi:hypothetical protein
MLITVVESEPVLYTCKYVPMAVNIPGCFLWTLACIYMGGASTGNEAMHHCTCLLVTVLSLGVCLGPESSCV